MKLLYRTNDVLVVFNFSKTTNSKITYSDKKEIVQTYAFSKQQFDYFKQPDNRIMGMLDNGLDAANCMDCPFSKNQGNKLGNCYTHKFPQMRGFAAMLRSIQLSWEEIPVPDEPTALLVGLCKGKYVRFGTYGETVFIPIAWYEAITAVASNWTGYTHQWGRKPEYSKFLMASVHSLLEQRVAEDLGFRCFNIYKEKEDTGNVLCPASGENAKSSCDRCSLCSGTTGKGKKSVEIKYH